jgi:CRP-like cAMP-binding protein
MKEMKSGCDTDKCMMCRMCIHDWQPAIKAHRSNFKVKKGELLFRENDIVKGIFFVYEGLFKVHKHWDDGKELIVRFAGTGDIVGHRGLGKDPYFPVSATAIESSVVCHVGLDFFNSTLKVNNEFIFSLLMFYASELQESERNMRNLAHMPVKGRIAQALLLLNEKFGTEVDGSIKINISRQDLASYAGTSYETLFRMLNELVAEEIVRLDEKRIIIADESRLKSLTSSQPFQ